MLRCIKAILSLADKGIARAWDVWKRSVNLKDPTWLCERFLVSHGKRLG
jgi:hypothetical protein